MTVIIFGVPLNCVSEQDCFVTFFLSFTKKILSFVNGMLRIVFLLLRVSD